MGRGVAAAAVLSLSMIGLGCNLTEPPPFDPEAITAIERSESAQMPPRPLRALPTTLQSPFDQDAAQPSYTPATGPALRDSDTLRVPLQDPEVLDLEGQMLAARADGHPGAQPPQGPREGNHPVGDLVYLIRGSIAPGG